MTLFKNRYRIETTRLRGWDYTAPGWYFVTICTQDRICHFGDVVEGIMQPSDIGDIVAEEWRRTEKVRPYVALDAWVVMPNHFHGILGICDHDGNMGGDGNVVETSRRDVSTAAVKPMPSRLYPHSLGAIIGQFKMVCTKRIRAAGYADFAWQPRFYDHIIRNERALHTIRCYIADNPRQWQHDRNHSTQ